MNLVSVPVLGAAALLAGPTLWQGLITGAVPLDDAFTRYAITVAIVWVALSAVALLIESTGPALPPTLQQAQPGSASLDGDSSVDRGSATG